jgi:hypothetical protein
VILQLNPPIHVLTPLGEGDCIGWIDYSCHVNTVWIVWLFDTGKVAHIDSSDIRLFGNAMYGIDDPIPFQRPEDAPGSPISNPAAPG